MAERASKLILDNEELTQGFFEDTRLLGIMAPIKDYQFCWQRNANTQKNFRANHELEIKLKKKRYYHFSVFEYTEPAKQLTHFIYNNKNDGEYLLPELKHLDFLWLLKGEAAADESLPEIIQQIKTINAVQLVVELTNEKIKNKENLVL